MSAECDQAVLCNPEILPVVIATYGANLLYLTTLILLSVFKYKVSGFTLHLLFGIELVMIAVFAQSILLLRVS